MQPTKLLLFLLAFVGIDIASACECVPSDTGPNTCTSQRFSVTTNTDGGTVGRCEYFNTKGGCESATVIGCDEVQCIGRRSCANALIVTNPGGKVSCSYGIETCKAATIKGCDEFRCDTCDGIDAEASKAIICSEDLACYGAKNLVTNGVIACSGEDSCEGAKNMVGTEVQCTGGGFFTCKAAAITSQCLTCAARACKQESNRFKATPCTWNDPNEISAPVDCLDESVPKVCPIEPVDEKDGGAFADPHFLTWKGSFFDYMGSCDLILVMVKDFLDGLPLQIHIRTEIRYDYSFISNAVINIANQGTFELSGFGQYLLDGVSNADLSFGIAGFPTSAKHVSSNLHLFTIDLGEGERIEMKSYKDMLSLKVHTNGNSTRFGKSLGMMGNYETGLMVARDGNTILDDPAMFADEWQVRDTEPMLFQAVREPQYPSKCILPDPTTKQSRRLGESAITLQMAQEACSGWASNLKEACIHDVLATQDLELAAAGSF